MKGVFVSEHLHEISNLLLSAVAEFDMEVYKCVCVCILAVGQRACLCPTPPEQAVSRPHLLCGVRGRAVSHPRPHLGATQTIPRHTLPPQQREVEGHTFFYLFIYFFFC